MTLCPTPDCNKALEHDAIMCGDCFTRTPKHLYRFLVRMRLAARRTAKPEDQKELHERFEANLNAICRTIKVEGKRRAKA